MGSGSFGVAKKVDLEAVAESVAFFAANGDQIRTAARQNG
jgi:hypothetical protein